MDAFTIGIVCADAPLAFGSYAVRHGNYSDGVNIEGITWNSHFTKLSIAVVNGTGDDYTDLDLAIIPDSWTYKAAIVGNSQCTLIPIGGNTIFSTISKGGGRKFTMHHVGDKFGAEDDMGDVFTPLATDGGYRLICTKFPRHFTLEVLFSSVSIDPDVLREASPARNLKSGEWGATALELANVKSDFDMLGPRPWPLEVRVTGGYTRILKRHSLERVIPVEGAD